MGAHKVRFVQLTDGKRRFPRRRTMSENLSHRRPVCVLRHRAESKGRGDTLGQQRVVRYLQGRALVERSVRRGQSLPRAPLRRGPRRTPRSTLAPETWPARPVPRVRARPRRRPSRIPRRLSVTPGVHITLSAPRLRSRRGPRPADRAARRRPSARSPRRADSLVVDRSACFSSRRPLPSARRPSKRRRSSRASRISKPPSRRARTRVTRRARGTSVSSRT